MYFRFYASENNHFLAQWVTIEFVEVDDEDKNTLWCIEVSDLPLGSDKTPINPG